ncbi:MAG TPA: cobyric acid synthase [Candidatus Atribacteria bacterium]|nr:cobyric acid synthase [Candidatus Atribacteria bacterium]
MKNRSLMVQGTGSGVGKSVIVAGLVRLFARQGIKVAPFKAQNMSCNSGITEGGEEIALAQILQAQAAFQKPDSRMNPIFLKPQGNGKSEIIIRGKTWAMGKVSSYYQDKEFFWEVIKESLDSLGEEYDLLILEGAGSPAEINLRGKDMANMKVALYLQSPVMVVGDIERGGVFASLYGTWALAKEERELIRAFIINKFRGDAEILKPGLREIEELTKVPVVGVLPYVSLSLVEEDSLLEKPGGKDCFSCSGGDFSLGEVDQELDWWSKILKRHLNIKKIEEMIGL